MTLQMEDVLMRGIYLGSDRVGGFRCGRVPVDWVYSPMPPKPPTDLLPGSRSSQGLTVEEFRA